MKQVTIKSIKEDEYFRLKPSESAPVWIRGYYEKSIKKYETYKYDDVNHELFMKGDRLVWID